MARPKLRRPDQPPWLRFLLGVYETVASLKLAVAVIAASAIVLGWATFVESEYGTEAVGFAIYGSWWFTALLGLLGLNVLCAALIRYPWRRYQVGFLVTHAGILILLLGCLIQKEAGVDAQMVIVEAGSSDQVFSTEKHFRLRLRPAGAPDAEAEEIEIPFRSGPFNWDDYSEHFFFPWQLAPRDQGVLYDRDGVTLEVLDYYADSKQLFVPRIELSVEPGAGSAAAAMGAEPQRVELAVAASEEMARFGRAPYGRGQRRERVAGSAITFWMTGSKEETAAFLDSRPQGPLGPLGQIVLWAEGKSYPLSVAELRERKPMPLGSTGIEVTLRQLNPSPMSALLEITPKDKPGQLISLHADHPYANTQDYRNGVFGTFWFAPPPMPEGADAQNPHAAAMRQDRTPRVDILLGHDGRLYSRQWVAPEVLEIGPWPSGRSDSEEVVGTSLTVFEQTPMPLELRIEDFVGAPEPEVRIEPVPFTRQKKGKIKQPRVLVRLTVDGNSGEFWLPIWFSLGGPPTRQQEAVVVGGDRRADVVLTYDTFRLGFQIYLHDFKRKLDSGSRMESHFSSLVDVTNHGDPPERLQEKVLITMNEPLSATDPTTRRSYRFYQADYDFVAKAGDPQFDAHIYGGSNQDQIAPREDLYNTRLSVNYDPGRGVKYAGCLLIVAGIATMFFMRAYFFQPRRVEAEKSAVRPAPEPSPTQ